MTKRVAAGEYAARFHDSVGGGEPFFLTVTRTRGPHSHTDVTLWFVLAADRAEVLRPDLGEFRSVRWFTLQDPAGWAAGDFDPQMHRFVAKLSAALDHTTALSSVPGR